MAVALYARVSTVRQAENDLSIPDQLRQMREWCTRQGHAIAMEYVELGASALSDRRPEFQRMMADATAASPSPYEAIIVHSQSRFFRDHIEFGLHERRLKKAGVRLIAITQDMGDDPVGRLTRSVISLYDQFASEENAKHTLRAMRENARQGYWNGSIAPLGYRVTETQVAASKGRRKKRLAINEVEAELVRQVFALYLHGVHGTPMGMKEIASHMNRCGVLMRGRVWTLQQVQRTLADTTYIGACLFNRRDSRTKRIKSREEWITFAVEPILDEPTFRRVEQRREASQLSKIRRVDTVETLLTGLLKCGQCGAGLMLVTGKSGQYRYYRCNTRMSNGSDRCDCPNIPMEKMDRIVLDALADRVCAPERLKIILSELATRHAKSKGEDDAKLRVVKKAIAEIEARQRNLFNAVEEGLIPRDQSLAKRAQELKAERESLLVQLAGVRTQQELPLQQINARRIEAFGKALRSRLLDRTAGLAKPYLRLMVDEVRVGGGTATIRGSNAVLARAVAQGAKGALLVPRTVAEWRTRRDSNSRPLPSEGSALSS